MVIPSSNSPRRQVLDLCIEKRPCCECFKCLASLPPPSAFHRRLYRITPFHHAATLTSSPPWKPDTPLQAQGTPERKLAVAPTHRGVCINVPSVRTPHRPYRNHLAKKALASCPLQAASIHLVRAKACARGNGHFFTCAFQLSRTVSTWGVVSSIRELTRNRVPSGLG